MKKGKTPLLLSLATLSIISSPLLAEEIFNEAAGQEQQDEQIRNLQNQKDLNHLFENSKFPVDDYIYKAGKKAPSQDGQNLGEILKKIEELEAKKQSGQTVPGAPTATPEDMTREQEQMAQRARDKQEELKAKQESLKQEIRRDNQAAYELSLIHI